MDYNDNCKPQSFSVKSISSVAIGIFIITPSYVCWEENDILPS